MARSLITGLAALILGFTLYSTNYTPAHAQDTPAYAQDSEEKEGREKEGRATEKVTEKSGQKELEAIPEILEEFTDINMPAGLEKAAAAFEAALLKGNIHQAKRIKKYWAIPDSLSYLAANAVYNELISKGKFRSAAHVAKNFNLGQKKTESAAMFVYYDFLDTATPEDVGFAKEINLEEKLVKDAARVCYDRAMSENRYEDAATCAFEYKLRNDLIAGAAVKLCESKLGQSRENKKSSGLTDAFSCVDKFKDYLSDNDRIRIGKDIIFDLLAEYGAVADAKNAIIRLKIPEAEYRPAVEDAYRNIWRRDDGESQKAADRMEKEFPFLAETKRKFVRESNEQKSN